MAENSQQRYTIRAGGTHVFRIDMRPALDETDTVSSASVAELTSADLTLSSVTVGTASATILGESVPASQWIQFTCSGHLAATGTYRLKITYSTAGGVSSAVLKEDFVFDVVS